MKKYILLILACALIMTSGLFPAFGQESSPIKKSNSSLTTNMVDQAVYYELTGMLRLERLYRKIFHKKIHAEDINVYDEIPDSSFFENRHARSPLSKDELEKGYSENEGPATDGPITVLKGKVEGLHPGFFIKDSRGDRYLLKFDSLTNLELNTSAEVIASRFYYAIGYHVPQYTVFTFDPSNLVPDEKATMIDRNGFKKTLTQDMLDQYILQLPRDSQGRLRASASKILAGESKGPFTFQGRRKDDPEDLIDHESRRVIRALQVFGAWLNNNDVRHENTLDMWVTENGKSFLKHYLIDFNATLGGAAEGAKPPMFSHEYFLDYGQIAKNYFGLGFRKSDWQKRRDEKGDLKNVSPAVGYFDNIRFYPDKYKVQLPYYAFKDLTRADGFWAAKIILSFSDDDIKAMVRAGRLSLQEDAEKISEILSARRDAIGRYWFSQVSPLESFNLTNGRISFSDLEIQRGFADSEGSLYKADVFTGNKPEGRPLTSIESVERSFEIPENLLRNHEKLTLIIHAKRASETARRPDVLVEITGDKITRVLQQD